LLHFCRHLHLTAWSVDMPRSGPRTVRRYSVAFKLTAVIESAAGDSGTHGRGGAGDPSLYAVQVTQGCARCGGCRPFQRRSSLRLRLPRGDERWAHNNEWRLRSPRRDGARRRRLAGRPDGGLRGSKKAVPSMRLALLKQDYGSCEPVLTPRTKISDPVFGLGGHRPG
jgi:hypothetical protein